MITIQIPQWFAELIAIWMVVGVWRYLYLHIRDRKNKIDARIIAKIAVVTRIRETMPPGKYEIEIKEPDKEVKNSG